MKTFAADARYGTRRSAKLPSLVPPIQRLGHAPRPQAKLTVSAPGDDFEREADDVAERVMRMPESGVEVSASSPPQIRRKCDECEEELRRSAEAGDRMEIPEGFAARFAAAALRFQRRSAPSSSRGSAAISRT